MREMQLYTLLEDNAKTSLENLEITGLTDVRLHSG